MRLEQLVMDSARRCPDALAVDAPDGRLTYRELDVLAGRIAADLRDLGVGARDRVVIWLEKSAYCVAAMQGTLRLGAGYVPLDPHIPPGRAAVLMSDCTPAVLVTSQDRLARLAETVPPTVLPPVLIAGSPRSATSLPGEPDLRQAEARFAGGAEELAYVLYTSGSTGEPKGVCVSHRNALAFIEWAACRLQITARDRLANHAPFQFDLSVFDLYGAFWAGASVHIIAQGTPGRGLTEFIRRHRITIWYSVPSALMLMIEHGRLLETGDSPLRAVVFAGEVLPIRFLASLRDRWPRMLLYNFYGPTETNVCAFYSVGQVPAERTRPVPIGKASCGNRIWAVRADGRVAEPGEEGELMVLGPTVMMGYHGGERQAGRPYATGDIVSLNDDGDYEYVGRRDDLVKLRGHRIALGEIESALLTHPDISEAVVVVTGEGHRARLWACIAFRADRRLTPIQVKQFLAGRLPRYMVIDRLHTVTRLPRTANGKADRQRLREEAGRSGAVASARPRHT